MISSNTRADIKGYLEGFIQGFIDQYKASNLNPKEPRPPRTYSQSGDIKPFHEALLPDGILRVNEFERSLSTKLGMSFEECARLIGKENYAEASRGHRIQGKISAEVIREIEQIVNEVGAGRNVDYPSLVQRILQIGREGSIDRERIADLYLKDNNGNEIFFEIKSPKPNKGQCLEVLDRLLEIHAMKEEGPPKVRTFYAMAYNPYGDSKSDYRHSFALSYMDIKNQVLIGSEFWDLVGGKDTYDEVIEIYREVGREKGPDMIDQLALRY